MSIASWRPTFRVVSRSYAWLRGPAPKPRWLPAHFLARRVAIELLVALWGISLAALLAACSCPHRDDLQAVVRERAAWVRGAPVAASGDTFHAALYLRFARLNELLAQPDVLALVPSVEETLALGSFGPFSSAITATLEARLLSLALRPDPRCSRCVAIDLRARYGVRLAGVRGLSSLGVPTTTQSTLSLQGTVPLSLGQGPDGRPRIVVDTAGLVVTASDLDLPANPSPIARAVRNALSGTAATTAARLVGELPIASFDPLALGLGGIQLAPVSLRTDAERDLLFVGFMSNLDVPTSAETTAWLSRRLDADARVVFAPRLPYAAVVAMLASGTIPRTFDGDGKPAEDGPYALTFEDLRFANDAFSARFKLWRRSCPCFVAELEAGGSITRVDPQVETNTKRSGAAPNVRPSGASAPTKPHGSFRALLTRVELVDTDRFETWIDAALWRQSSFSDALARTSERFLHERVVTIGGNRLILRAGDYSLSEAGLVVAGDLTVDTDEYSSARE